jgi:pimeloyl-ACP methyl ester carboxylesterase
MSGGVRVTTGDGVTLYVESTGDGPAIVFVHEFADDLRSWEPQVRRFSRSFRCVAFNARGYPPSDVPSDPAAYSQARAVADVFAVMDALGVARAHVVGHSMGAYTALHVALEAPQRVASLTATGCGWGSGPDMRAEIVGVCTGVARLFREEGIERAAIKYTDVPMRLPFKAKDRRGWDAFIARLSEHSAEGSALTMLGVQMRRPTLPDLVPRLRRMKTPLLIVVGDGDEPCLDGSLLLKRTVPDAALLVVPRTGHAPNGEEPALFNAALAEHLLAHPA